MNGEVSAEQELVCTRNLDLFGADNKVHVPGSGSRAPVPSSRSRFSSCPSAATTIDSHVYSPKPGAMETVAVTISEYSKVSHFYLKEITYYK